MTIKVIDSLKIEDIIGHHVEAEISLKGYFEKSKFTLIGRIIYSDYNASLAFKPKGSKTKCYLIESIEDIHSVKIIRRDNKNNKYYLEAYNNRVKFELALNERLKKENEERQEQERLREERIELKRKLEQEKKQKEIDEAKSLGGYEELEKEVIEFYQSFEEEFFNESFVKNTYIPILNKLIHKAIDNVSEYPKYYFDKKHNPKFTELIERMTNVKLGNTQKGNVEILNSYLAN